MPIVEKVYDGQLVRKEISAEKWAHLQTLPGNHGWKVVDEAPVEQSKPEQVKKEPVQESRPEKKKAGRGGK
jgi:hypothetical protein